MRRSANSCPVCSTVVLAYRKVLFWDRYYSPPVGNVIESFGVRHQQYADDTQLYLSMRPSDSAQELDGAWLVPVEPAAFSDLDRLRRSGWCGAASRYNTEVAGRHSRSTNTCPTSVDRVRRSNCVAYSITAILSMLCDSEHSLLAESDSFRQFLKTFLFATYWCI